MARGFWGHRLRPLRPLKDLCHKSKEIVVTRRERKQPRPLKVRVTFAPNRLSPEWMAQAYEQVVPIARRPTTKVSFRQQTEQGRQQQHAGRRSTL